MQEIVLQTNNLTKKYKDFVALDNATITIHKGDIYTEYYYITSNKQVSKEIFDTLIKRFDLNKEETIFFDDSPKNVKAGNEYGVKSYVFNSIKDITTLEL